jgi:DNA repair protein RecO (recombination protein O)
MNNQIVTDAIVLSRTDYGEADRIITFLTPDHGKVRLMAKGVRRLKSKLAGGIELFSVSRITFIRGRGDIGTLISTRLSRHYGTIIKDINRVQLGYDLIKLLNKVTEDNSEADYFNLLLQVFAALDDASISTDLIQAWFTAQLLKLGGHTPNMQTDTGGAKLAATQSYNFDFDAMTFFPHTAGQYDAAAIKFLRLLFSSHEVTVLNRVNEVDRLTAAALKPLKIMQASVFSVG